MRREPFVQPGENRSNLGVQVAQTLDQTHRERALQRHVSQAAQHFIGRDGLLPAGAKHLIGQRIGFQTRVAAVDNPFSDSSQVFHQHDAQNDRDRPQFTDAQRLHSLVRHDETMQHFRIEPAIGVRHISPGHSVHPRISFQMAGNQFGKLAVETYGQVVSNLAELFFHDVKIVEEPFGGGRNALLELNRVGRGAVIFQQSPAVFQDARKQRPARTRIRIHHFLRPRQAFGVLLQALDAEKFSANRLFQSGGYDGRGRRLAHANP